MNRFLDNYIETLSSRRQERVASLLEEAKVAKDQIGIISDRLANLGNLVPLLLVPESPEGQIAASNFEVNFRDSFVRIKELYEVSNLVSLLLDSHAAVLGSDVKALEDHLAALEKMAANYSFLLSDGGSYNYAYLEPFSDERGRETFDFNIPDRASQVFGPAEQAIIRTDEGVLALPDVSPTSHSMSVSVIKGNATAFTTSDTGVQNLLSPSSATGWRMTIASANPITSGLPEANGTVGAQVVLEFTTSQPVPASEVKIVPFADMAMDLVQVTLYPKLDDDSKSVPLLTAPTQLDRPYTLFFPMQSVAKFRIILNQSVYNRLANLVSVPETNYQQLLNEIAERDKDRYKISKIVRIRKIQVYIRLLKKKKHGHFRMIALPRIDFHPHWGPLRIDKVIQKFQHKLGHYDLWERQEHFEQALLRLFKKHPSMKHKIFFREKIKYEEIETVVVDPNTPAVTVVPAAVNPPVLNQGFFYQYNLGLQYVAIGSSAPGFKGVFVSKTMPAPGDIGQVRLKSTESNYRLPMTDRQSSLVTSIEYSVSNQSDPSDESDWIPILPVVSANLIEAERFFPDSAGRGFFRFPASLQDYLVLYKNGYRVYSGFSSIYSAVKDSIVGLSLANGTYTSDDIFTVDYVPASDQTTVNFENSGFADIPLVAAHDNTGAGEGFSTSAGRDAVDLTYEPYIDYDQVATSTYSSAYGLTPYQPLTIRFDDGSMAINLTNYKREDQASLPDASAGYYYVHSGSAIQFNQTVNKPFRVYYQYLQNNVRVRVVLRVNAKTFTSPSVDYFHLKAKTRRSDALGT